MRLSRPPAGAGFTGMWPWSAAAVLVLGAVWYAFGPLPAAAAVLIFVTLLAAVLRGPESLKPALVVGSLLLTLGVGFGWSRWLNRGGAALVISPAPGTAAAELRATLRRALGRDAEAVEVQVVPAGLSPEDAREWAVRRQPGDTVIAVARERILLWRVMVARGPALGLHTRLIGQDIYIPLRWPELLARDPQEAARMGQVLRNYERNDLTTGVWRQDFAGTDEETLANLLVLEGLAWHRRGDWKQAQARYGEAIAADPQVMQAYLLRGVGFFEQGDHVAAVQDLLSVTELEPPHATAYYIRGVARRMLGELPQARYDFRLCLTAATSRELRSNAERQLQEIRNW